MTYINLLMNALKLLEFYWIHYKHVTKYGMGNTGMNFFSYSKLKAKCDNQWAVFSWTVVIVGFFQGPILSPVLLSIYTNTLPDALFLNFRSTDGTSFSSIVQNEDTSI